MGAVCCWWLTKRQNLPIAALEELRMLSNFQQGERALLQTFLLGQPEFRDQLAAAPELEQLRQRVIATHHLEPMSRDELPAYIEHRLKTVGWRGDPSFTDAAYDAMFDYSGGVPRRLNNLASRVLLFGALEDKHAIDEPQVNEVIDDLRRDTNHGGGPDPNAPIPSIVQGNVPPKMRSPAPEAPAEVLVRRVEMLERHVRAQDKAIRDLLDLLAGWDEDDAPVPPTAAAEPRAH